MLPLNIFTAIANNITPKNFLTTDIPDGPKIRSRKSIERNVMKINTRLNNMAINIL